MRIRLHWTRVDEDDDHELWDVSPVIYAYGHRREILYIGKADGTSTTRSRWNAADKDDVFDYFEERNIVNPRVLVGEFLYDGRLTREIVADVESLLIAKLRPRGNISAIRSRVERPGLYVHCTGACWPKVHRRFLDP
jgi:hypothetical protein